MRPVVDNDELLGLHNGSSGYIYNDYRGATARGASGNVVHQAGCSSVGKSNTKYPKLFFSTLNEAIVWLESNRGQEGLGWRRCGCCSTNESLSDRSIGHDGKSNGLFGPLPTTPSLAASSMHEGQDPFAEPLVEALLVAWLQGHGYEIKKRVRVSNGIVDVVATYAGTEWVIEVKGEDRGNFNTAEMNFRIGVTQICSRISSRANREYVLAIPLTPKFRRVLIKQEQFEVFPRMGLWLFVVSPDGSVIKIPPAEVQAFRDAFLPAR